MIIRSFRKIAYFQSYTKIEGIRNSFYQQFMTFVTFDRYILLSSIKTLESTRRGLCSSERVVCFLERAHEHVSFPMFLLTAGHCGSAGFTACHFVTKSFLVFCIDLSYILFLFSQGLCKILARNAYKRIWDDNSWMFIKSPRRWWIFFKKCI